MKTSIFDLKLLVDIAYSERFHGVTDYAVPIGFEAASKRLARAGLIVLNNCASNPKAQITRSKRRGASVGTNLVNAFLQAIEDEHPVWNPETRRFLKKDC